MVEAPFEAEMAVILRVFGAGELELAMVRLVMIRKRRERSPSGISRMTGEG